VVNEYTFLRVFAKGQEKVLLVYKETGNEMHLFMSQRRQAEVYKFLSYLVKSRFQNETFEGATKLVGLSFSARYDTEGHLFRPDLFSPS
jgi:hypothetical protein